MWDNRAFADLTRLGKKESFAVVYEQGLFKPSPTGFDKQKWTVAEKTGCPNFLFLRRIQLFLESGYLLVVGMGVNATCDTFCKKLQKQVCFFFFFF